MPKLFAPESYWDLTPEVKAQLTNGCGTGGWKSWIIPDSMWFLNIREACNIHDFMYMVGDTEEDREEADEVFLNNLLRIIDHKGGWLAPLRRRRARKYYLAVKYFGGPAFWSGKNSDATFKEI